MSEENTPTVEERHALYDVIDQLKALGLISRYSSNELLVEARHVYGLGCILDRLASEIETQIGGN